MKNVQARFFFSVPQYEWDLHRKTHAGQIFSAGKYYISEVVNMFSI